MTGEPESSDKPQAERDFWERTFDDPKGAKHGCFGTLAVVIAAPILLIGYCSSHNSAPAPAPTTTPTPQEESEESKAIDAKVESEANLKAMLKDADSAKFRKEFVARVKGGNLILCGEVNSKNSFGAYGGFDRFIASPNPEVPVVIDGEAFGSDQNGRAMFQQAWNVACMHRVLSF